MTSERLSAIRPNSGIKETHFVAEVSMLSEDGKEHSDGFSLCTICKTNRHKNYMLMQDGLHSILSLCYPSYFVKYKIPFPDSFYCVTFCCFLTLNTL